MVTTDAVLDGAPAATRRRPRHLYFPVDSDLPEQSRWLSEALDEAKAEQTQPDLLIHLTSCRPAASGLTSVAQWSRWDKALRRLERWHGATVAVVDGAVEATALQLLLTVDAVIASPASTFSSRDIHCGHLPGMALHRLAKHIGLGHAKRLLYSGVPVPAGEALRLGLVAQIAAQPTDAATGLLDSWPDAGGNAWPLARRLLLESYSYTYEDALGGVLAAQERALREGGMR